MSYSIKLEKKMNSNQTKMSEIQKEQQTITATYGN